MGDDVGIGGEVTGSAGAGGATTGAGAGGAASTERSVQHINARDLGVDKLSDSEIKKPGAAANQGADTGASPVKGDTGSQPGPG